MMLLIFSFSNCFTSKEHYQCFYHQLSICEMSWFAFLCSLLGLSYLAHVGLLFPLSRRSGAWTLWLYRGNVSLLCGTSSLCSESISVRCSDGWGEGGLLRVGVRWCPHTSCTARAWAGASCSRFRSILETGQRSGRHSGSLLGWWRRRVQAGWGALAASSAAGFLLRQPRGLGVVDGAGRPQEGCLKVEPHRSPRGVLMPSGSLRPFRQSPQTCLSQQCSQAIFPAEIPQNLESRHRGLFFWAAIGLQTLFAPCLGSLGVSPVWHGSGARWVEAVLYSHYWLVSCFLSFFLTLLLFLTEVQLTYSIIILLGAQHNDLIFVYITRSSQVWLTSIPICCYRISFLVMRTFEIYSQKLSNMQIEHYWLQLPCYMLCPQDLLIL